MKSTAGTRTTLSHGRMVLVALLALAIVAVLVGEEQLVRPSALTLVRFNAANVASGWTRQVAFLWTIETFNPTMSLEGPSGDAAPTALRIATSAGEVLTTDGLKRLDPSRNIGVCPMHRPETGASWWAGTVPEAMADELRTTGHTSYRLEVFRDTTWSPVLLIDSGCRGVGRL